MDLPDLPASRSIQRRIDQDICRFVIARLPHDRAYRADLASRTAIDLLIIYMNWQLRIVQNERRQVHVSRAVATSRYLDDPLTRTGLERVKVLLASGGNIHPHLSKGILSGYAPRQPVKKLNARPDLDMLLNDWGLHHLHLSTEYYPGGFSKRSKTVIVSAFKPGHAYLVDLIEHGERADDRLIRIIRSEWPEAGLIHRLNGVLASSTPMAASERRLMRNVGISTSVDIDGEVYLPSLGYSSSGVATSSVTQADRLYRQVRQFCDNIEKDRDWPIKEMARNGMIARKSPEFHFTALPTGEFVIMDSASGYAFRLS